MEPKILTMARLLLLSSSRLIQSTYPYRIIIIFVQICVNLRSNQNL